LRFFTAVRHVIAEVDIRQNPGLRNDQGQIGQGPDMQAGIASLRCAKGGNQMPDLRGRKPITQGILHDSLNAKSHPNYHG
jgi:hypothetical protein